MSDDDMLFEVGRELLRECQTTKELSRTAGIIARDKELNEQTKERLRPIYFSVERRINAVD